MDGKSLDVKQEKIERLKEVMPEAFTEGKVDWEKLKAALGEDVEFKNERYVQIFITLDKLFKNNDQLKTNTLLQMKDAGIEFKVV